MAWYRVELRRCSWTELWRLAGGPLGFALFVGRWIRGVPLVEREPALRDDPATPVAKPDLPPSVADGLGTVVDRLVPLGFRILGYWRLPTGETGASAFDAMLHHESGRAMARATCTTLAGVKTVECGFASRMGDRLLVTTTARPSYQLAPDEDREHVKGRRLGLAWERHRQRLAAAGGGEPVEPSRSLFEEEMRRRIEIGVKRGLLVPMTEEDVARVRARPPLQPLPQVTPMAQGATPVTWALLGVMVAVFVAAHLPFGQDLVVSLASGTWAPLTSSVVHLEAWHLLFNAMALAYLGRVSEAVMGSARYLAFFGAAAVISGYAQLAVSVGGIGASGVLYALFGYLWLVRGRIPRGRELVSDELVRMALGWLVACVLLTWLGILRIGNAAHISGLLVGMAVGGLQRAWTGRPPGA